MEKQDLISIIVPVYNVEKYLEKCIDSILNQDYQAFELFLVDDGSTDESGMICDAFEKKDSRIRVIHKKNGGLSDARNAAIDKMSGDYVVFIDSDDYVESNYLSVLLGLIKKYNVDISACNFVYMNENGKILNRVDNDGKILLLEQKDALSKILEGREINTSAGMKMYSSRLFKDIRYPLGKLYEDISTTYKLFLKVDRVVYQNYSLYTYLCRGGSITKTGFTIKRMDAVYNLEIMCNDIKYHYPQLEPRCNASLFSQYVTTYGAAIDGNAEKKVLDEMYDAIINLKSNVYFSKKMKIYFLISRLNRLMFNCCIKIENYYQKKRKL